MNIHFDTGDVMDKIEKMSENLTIGLYEALGEAGEVVRADAVSNCPVMTGRLRGSITNKVDGNCAIIGTNVEYAPYVEFGTGSKGDKSVAHTSKEKWTYYSGGQFFTTSGQSPQPFLVPALKNNSAKIKEILRRAVMK
jgi:HK97 gp10 family phage protein